jgi:hypothetical protein
MIIDDIAEFIRHLRIEGDAEHKRVLDALRGVIYSSRSIMQSSAISAPGFVGSRQGQDRAAVVAARD